MLTDLTWPNIHYHAKDGSWGESAMLEGVVSSSDGDGKFESVRERYSTVSNRETSLSIELDVIELYLFNYFFSKVTKNGLKWFTMPIWSGGTYVNKVVRFINAQYPSISSESPERVLIKLNLEVYEE